MAGQPTSHPQRRFLLLAESGDAAEQWLPLLRDWGQVRVVTSLADARGRAARAGLRRGAVSRGGTAPARLSDGTRSGTPRIGRDCAGDLHGRTRRQPDLDEHRAEANTRRRPLRRCARRVRLRSAPSRRSPHGGTHQQSLSLGQKQSLDLTVSALRGTDGGVERVVGFVNDTTTLARMREKLDAIDAAGRQLVALNADEMSGLGSAGAFAAAGRKPDPVLPGLARFHALQRAGAGSADQAARNGAGGRLFRAGHATRDLRGEGRQRHQRVRGGDRANRTSARTFRRTRGTSSASSTPLLADGTLAAERADRGRVERGVGPADSVH